MFALHGFAGPDRQKRPEVCRRVGGVSPRYAGSVTDALRLVPARRTCSVLPDAGGRMTGKSRRGFASMDPTRQREIASKGGRAAHEKGTAHEWSSDEARNAGRKGGVTVSRDRAHMAAIGREGGESRSAAAREARMGGRNAEREVPMQVARDGDRSRPAAPSADRAPVMPRSDESSAR
jgi:uncharacterized protein